jgi:hypothetical protein
MRNVQQTGSSVTRIGKISAKSLSADLALVRMNAARRARRQNTDSVRA